MDKHYEELEDRINIMFVVIALLIGALLLTTKVMSRTIKNLEKEKQEEHQKAVKYKWELEQVNQMICNNEGDN